MYYKMKHKLNIIIIVMSIDKTLFQCLKLIFYNSYTGILPFNP